MTVSPHDLASVYKATLASFINAGYIDPAGMSPEEIHSEFARIAEALPDDFDVVIDHTPKLLSLARQFRRDGKLELSVLMYATWVEHNLNLILRDLAYNASVEDKYILSMIKESSSRAKATWLLGLLGGKSLPPKALVRMQKLSDARNAFVHYKWGQLSAKAKADQEAALIDSEHLVQTIQRMKRRDLKLVSHKSRMVQSAFQGLT
jgi:hypothetical protein